MHRRLSRRTLTTAAPASRLAFGSPVGAFAQTPDASPEDDRHPDLLARLAATDPRTALDLLLEIPFDLPWLVPLASNPPFQPEAYDASEDETFGTEMIGAVNLVHPDRDGAMGGFLVFPDENLAAEAIERALSGATSEDATVERLTLAGLDAAMGLFDERTANVVVQADYVVIVSTDQILADGAYTNSFAAQIRALQHALGLTWHLFRALRQ